MNRLHRAASQLGARMMIHQWLAEMREAAARDDAASVAELARCIKAKIEQQQQWQREDEARRR